MIAEDIRIGNLFKDEDGNIVEIVSISHKGVNLYGEIIPKGNYDFEVNLIPYYKFDELIPLKIVEHWPDAISESTFKYGEYVLEYRDKYPNGYWYVTNIFTGNYIGKVKYVHELQNIENLFIK